MRVLAVTYGLPWPLSEGAKIRDYHLLRELAKDGEVALLSFCKDDREPPDPRELKQFCVDVETYVPPLKKAWTDMPAHLASRRPLAAFPFYFEPFARRIAALAERHGAETVQLEHSFLAAYVDAVPRQCKKVLSLHNIGERQYERMARLSGMGPTALLKSLAMRGWEAEWAKRFDFCIAVSQQEADWLRLRAPGLPVAVIENGVDCTARRMLPPAMGGNPLFVGALGYPPNVDAVILFARVTLPILRRSIPDARLVTVGKNPGAAVRTLADEGLIELHGDAADVVPYYQRALACVAPLRAGGGTRLKILEAMALGRPVVSTPVGCEGLEVSHGNQLLIAESPDAMASELVRLAGDPDLSRQLCARARRWVEDRHDWRTLGAKLRRLHQDLAASTVGSRQ